MTNSLLFHGHRERKKQRTREKLIDAALRLFIERGYEETRIEDIVAEVDLVPRTFFRYFCSKDDALFGWYDSVRSEAVASLRGRPRGEGLVRALAASLLEIARAHHGQERIARVLHQIEAKSPEIRARRAAWLRDLQNDLASAVASRLPSSTGLVAATIAAAVTAAFSVAAEKWATDDAQRPLQEYAESSMTAVVKLFDKIDQQYVLR
jgi:AcrR family transcriptional regulator